MIAVGNALNSFLETGLMNYLLNWCARNDFRHRLITHYNIWWSLERTVLQVRSFPHFHKSFDNKLCAKNQNPNLNCGEIGKQDFPFCLFSLPQWMLVVMSDDASSTLFCLRDTDSLRTSLDQTLIVIESRRAHQLNAKKRSKVHFFDFFHPKLSLTSQHHIRNKSPADKIKLVFRSRISIKLEVNSFNHFGSNNVRSH